MTIDDQLRNLLTRSELEEHANLPGVPVAVPDCEQQARELVSLATRDKRPFMVLGMGSKLGWSMLAQSPSFAISTRQLTGVIEFEPGDGVLTARAGTTMAELEAVTKPHGLGITPAVPRSQGATLGGVIAAGQGGWDSMAHGPARMHVLGTHLLQLDGCQTRSGGRLVKNVSGYDIHRLLTGSFGSLGIITEASLRLVALPQARVLLTASSVDLNDPLKLAALLLASKLRPEALLIENAQDPSTWNLHLSLAGHDGHVEEQQRIAEVSMGSPRAFCGDQARSAMQALGNMQPDGKRVNAIRVNVRPSNFASAFRELQTTLPGARIIAQPRLGTLLVEAPELSITPESLHRLRQTLEPLGALASLRRSNPLTPEFAPRAKDPVRAKVAERLRAAFDPEKLLCTRPPLEPCL